MNIELVQRHFARIGANLRIENVRDQRWRWLYRTDADYQIDITDDGKGESFVVRARENALDNYEFLAVHMRPDERHLLLMARNLESRAKQKFLCGHDERHWFVAGIPDEAGAATVQQAMEALKPQAVQHAQRMSGVKRKQWNSRRNPGFVRQGEWFFIPDANGPGEGAFILRNEPLQRGGGKPHMVEEVSRTGGEVVYVCSRHPNGITEEQFQRLLRSSRHAKGWNWTVMRRNPDVHARGWVRHPDHKTIVLPSWHRVRMSNESNGVGNNRVVAFLD